MKKLIFGLIATVMFTSFSFGQEKLNENNIGEYHNLLMEKYYNLISKKDFKKITKDDFVQTFNEVATDVFGVENKEIIEKSTEKFEYNFNSGIEKNIENSKNEIKLSKLSNKKLEEFIINYTDECKNIELKNYEKYFNSKKDEANKQFTGKDLEIALIGINTGLASADYWSKNLEKWDILIGNQNSTLQRSGPGVGGADVGGACAGALWGGFGGTMFLPGVGTVAGAVGCGVAGGLYASTAAAAAGLWNALTR